MQISHWIPNKNGTNLKIQLAKDQLKCQISFENTIFSFAF